MTKILSIIIPHFRSETGLRKLLGSIMSSLPVHKLQAIEVIVIDDNSLDLNSFKTLKNNYPSALFLRNNSGVKGAGAARNVGLKNATGDYLLFADADDFLTDDWSNIIYPELENKKYDVIFFPPSCVSLTGSKPTRHLRYVRLVHDFINNNDESIRYRFHVPWSKLILRKLVEDNRIFFDEVVASNDVSFSLKVGSLAKLICCKNKPIYVVTESIGSLTTSKSIERLMSRLCVLLDYNKSLTKMGKSEYSISLLPLIYEIFKIDSTKGVKLFYNLIKERQSIFHFSYFKRFFLRKVF